MPSDSRQNWVLNGVDQNWVREMAFYSDRAVRTEAGYRRVQILAPVAKSLAVLTMLLKQQVLTETTYLYQLVQVLQLTHKNWLSETQ